MHTPCFINSQTIGITRAGFHPAAHDADAKRLHKCYNEFDRNFWGIAHSPPVKEGRTIRIPEVSHACQKTLTLFLG